jgi:hypothetical protein
MKGVVTHKNTGKVYFNAWSMDVKFEGRMSFGTLTHNAQPLFAPARLLLAFAASQAVGSEKNPCEKEKANLEAPVVGKPRPSNAAAMLVAQRKAAG